MLRLVELHVRKYRDLVDGGPLRFGPGPVFLLGPNGSGKTTLLELIGVLLGDDLGPLFKEEEAVELSWVLEAEAKRVTTGKRVTTRLELSLSIDAIPRSTTTDARTAKLKRRGWTIHGKLPARNKIEQMIEFWQDSEKTHLFKLGTGETLNVKAVGIEPSEKQWLYSVNGFELTAFTTEGIEIELHDRFSPFFRQLAEDRLIRFDEANAQFNRLVDNHDDAIIIQATGDIVGTSERLPPWVHFSSSNVIPNNDHPDIILLIGLLGAERVEFRPRLVFEDGRGHRRWVGFDIYVHWGGGAMHHHSELSFGQKRLIALVWQIGLNPEFPLPLLTDEMTNGLHAGWVQAIIDHLGPRQGFHAVQNPLLLDRYGPGEGPEEIAGRFVICTVETAERGRQWRWRSPTTVECERLWAAYLAGFQHLSELLISEGLW